MQRIVTAFVLLLSLLGLSFPLAAAEGVPNADAASVNDSAADEASRGRTAYILIDGPIDRHRHRYFLERLETAREAGVDRVIVHINTDGGRVDFAREMLLAAVKQKHDGPEMIAYVDFRAISAGAMIAYGHAQVYLAEEASIGDIGVIFQTQEGMEYAPEKVETVVRTLLSTAAEQRGWDRAQILKMTARNQELYLVKMPDGSTQYVIQDDLPTFLQANPDIDPDTDVAVDMPEDRLLTMTGKEALERGMASGTMPSLEALYEHLEIDPDHVLDLAPTTNEVLAWNVGGYAPLLAGLAMLFLFFELKTPGVGVFAILAAICGGLFLTTHFALDMISAVDLVLVGLGLTLIIVDLSFGLSGGILLLLGAIVTVIGLVMFYLPNGFDPTDLTNDEFIPTMTGASIDLLITISIGAIGIVAFIASAERSPLVRRFAHTGAITATSDGERAATAEELIGHTATLRAECHPVGVAVIDGREYSARSQHGAFLAAGSSVTIVGQQFGEVIVSATTPTADGAMPETATDSDQETSA